ncbi:MAG: hypothetical protein P1U32_01015 [Legionellaceae bacterium]|nr:hypothetical protein [Legionellaceae bacterium]
MGLEGLRSVLALLRDDEAENKFAALFKARSAFYLACEKEENYLEYLETFLAHLQRHEHFPFSRVGLAYHSSQFDNALLQVVALLNHEAAFDEVVLTDCLQKPDDLSALLTRLIHEASEHNWQAIILIPELQGDGVVKDAEHRALKNQYSLLNDIILNNKRLAKSKDALEVIKKATTFEKGVPAAASSLSASGGMGVSGGDGMGEEKGDELQGSSVPGAGLGASVVPSAAKFQARLQNFSIENAGKTWPFRRGGALRLQVQQQQELQQQREVQQEKEKVTHRTTEQVFFEELVTYENIDRLLGAGPNSVWNKFLVEHPEGIHLPSARLKTPAESDLQGFFHTWVNVNPQVKAKHAIQKITREAAEMLLKSHRHLSSGLKVDNLPRGFFTQRSKDDELVLCYDANLGYLSVPTKLTLDLTARPLAAKAWEGDFRQFNIDAYKDDVDTRDLADPQVWEEILLFAHLQPKKVDYDDEFDAFIQALPRTERKKYTDNKQKIKDNWHVFVQCFRYAGDAGVAHFLAVPVYDLAIQPVDTVHYLCQKQASDLQGFAKYYLQDERAVRALGQVYYQYGDNGVTVLLRKLQEIEYKLGAPFFDEFVAHVLNRTDNFNVLMSSDAVRAFDSMMERLKLPDSAPQVNPERDAFVQIMQKHMASVDWEQFEKLWGGFESFVKELAQLGVKLEGHEFDDVEPENMLVCMDQILSSLERLSESGRKAFLKRLGAPTDLTYGGVHYALQKEGYQNISPELELHDFEQGHPTYAADLKELYTHAFDALQMKRALAVSGTFQPEAFDHVVGRFATADEISKDNLIWLLHTRYRVLANDIDAIITQIEAIDPQYKSIIARHLQKVVYERGHKHAAVSLAALQDALLALKLQPALLQSLCLKHPNGTFLEALTILHETGRLGGIGALVQLFDAPLDKPEVCTELLSCQAYKLATLFEALDPQNMADFYAVAEALSPTVIQELRVLMPQLLSINTDTSDLAALTPERFQDVLQCIRDMIAKPTQVSALRMALLTQFEALDIEFKYSKSGAFRAVNDEDSIININMFVDHKTRLKAFLKGHIAVSALEGANTEEELAPMMRFLTGLQMNRTYLNEVEPLLATLEKTPAERYWTASYFKGLLRALQPESADVSFPISLLKVVIEGRQEKQGDEVVQIGPLCAKKLNEVEENFPEALVAPFQKILNEAFNSETREGFNREQQAMLCRIALKEYEDSGNVGVMFELSDLLSKAQYEGSRTYALDMLAKCKTVHRLEQQRDNCRWLLQHLNGAEIRPETRDALQNTWPEVGELWLKALSANDSEQTLFDVIKVDCSADPNRQALLLHIIAYSSLKEGLVDSDLRAYTLSQKAPKLVRALNALDDEALFQLASCYPGQPAPNTDDIRRLMKRHETEGVSFEACLEDFAQNPYPEPRLDYGDVSLTRDADLQRMIAETRVSGTSQKAPLSARQSAELTLIFMQLKRLEAGTAFVKGYEKSIREMTDAERAQAFKDLSLELQDNPRDAALRAQVWALLFEVMGSSTKKYPHLAQQFALIANDIGVTANKRVLQLATGEGKSHFVAMRAARHAALGKRVDVCTAKRTLAKRDLEDYHAFFDNLGFKTAYIHSKSPSSSYTDAQICYTTLGDLSLFLDEQKDKGKPIVIEPKNRVGLFDEFDFIRFEEGRKTEYNFARLTGKTPKEMTWFYQGVNRFFEDKGFTNRDAMTVDTLENLYQYLCGVANEDQQLMLHQVLIEPLQLVQWLQAACEAGELKWGEGFTVRELNIQVGEELYPMREVIPVSQDNQAMQDSTFSGGVHQLAGTKLNTEAEKHNQPQNFHIHPESIILSSQVAPHLMKTLWSKWEGFSGTISAAQASQLHEENGTEVLHVPTNQRDLRNWHKPEFYANDTERVARLVQQIRTCLSKKQSILFACKNDTKVNELKALLKGDEERAGLLTPDECEQLIFYTNEELRSASDVLDDKRQKEAWHGGKKQNGIGLIASGFGRGDNVEVEAVFLFDINDNNEKLQKGGRTARNGAEGEVFQFYIESELEQEENRLLQLLNLSLEADESEDEDASHASGQSNASLRENLLRVEGATENERRLERVLLLREYLFALDNAPNLGYRDLKAAFSDWGMNCLGSVTDDAVRKEVTYAFSVHMKALDRDWLEVLSQTDLDVDEKLQAIHQKMLDRADIFRQDAERNELDFDELALDAPPPVHIELVVPPPARKPTAHEKAVGVICGVMQRLKDADINHPSLYEIPGILSKLESMTTPSKDEATLKAQVERLQAARIKYLEEQLKGFEKEREVRRLAGHPTEALDKDIAAYESKLHAIQNVGRIRKISLEDLSQIFEALQQDKLVELAEEVADCDDLETLHATLARGLRQLQTPSPHGTSVTAAIESIKPEALLVDVSPELREAYTTVMRGIEPSLQTSIVGALCAPNVMGTHSAQERIERALPLLSYLERFNATEQTRWGDAYVTSVIGVPLSKEQQAILDAHLSFSIPMSYEHFQALSQLAEMTHGTPHSFGEMFRLLEETVEKDPENRLRLLTKWESWAKSLSQAEKQAFLIDFCGAMQQFKEGQNWDVLLGLIDKTHKWWNKFGEDKYRPDIMRLWHNLARHGASIRDFDDFLHLSRTSTGLLGDKDPILQGKSWFQVLNLALDMLEPERLTRHKRQLAEAWRASTRDNLKKAARTEIFERACHGLNLAHAHIDSFDEATKEACHVAFLSLDGLRFENFTLFVEAQDALLEAYPFIFTFALRYIADEDIPIARATRVREVVLAWANDDALNDSQVKTLLSQLDALQDEVFINLDDARFAEIMRLTEEHRVLFATYPELYASMLHFSIQPDISLECLGVLADLLVEAGQFKQAHPELLTFEPAALAGAIGQHSTSSLEALNDRLTMLRQVHQATDDNQTLFSEVGEVCDALFVCAFDEEVPPANMLPLITLFKDMAEFKQAHPRLVNARLLAGSIIAQRMRDAGRLEVLDEKLQFSKDLTDKHQALFEKYPRLHEVLLDYAFDSNMTRSTLECLSNLLVCAGEFHMTHPEIPLDHLIDGVNQLKWNDTSDVVLKNVYELFQAKTSEQPLFDGAAAYLTNHKRAHGNREAVLQVMKMFYAARGKHRSDTTGMLSEPDIAECFAFKANESNAVRERRVIWTHLLDQEVFCEDDEGADLTVPHRWTNEKNSALLDASYGQYMSHTKAVLAAPSAKPKLRKLRDLTLGQQAELLRLSDELGVIVKKHTQPLKTTEEVKAQVDTLNQSLTKLSKQYKGSWFKSKSRVSQLKDLTSDMEKALSDLSATDQTASAVYVKVLETLRDAKKAAMQEDIQDNEKRTLKLNWTGRSRYFNTLNQMQDAVLRQWTEDLDAVQRFKVYKAHHTTEFRDALEGLNEGLDAHMKNPARVAPSDPKYDSVLYRIARFFGLFTDERAVDKLKDYVTAFEKFEEGVQNRKAVQDLTNGVQELLPRLPGYLKTLANELLARSEALAQTLSTELDDDIRDTLDDGSGFELG